MSPISVQASSQGHFLGWHGDMGLPRGIAIPLPEGKSPQNERWPGRLGLGSKVPGGPDVQRELQMSVERFCSSPGPTLGRHRLGEKCQDC